MTIFGANQSSDAALVLADGSVFRGKGAGAQGAAVGELCFNTAMTGYQEVLSDPSYADQIICFTFPHIGNVGANAEDAEATSPAASVAARGAVLRAPITEPSNWRATLGLQEWLERRGVIAITGIDTRALTRRIRENGMPHAAIAFEAEGLIDTDALAERARAWAGIEGRDLASRMTADQAFALDETAWSWPDGVGALSDPRFHVVVLDYGVKRNIARSLAAIGARTTVLPAKTTAEEILAMEPDGVVLSNGPGDPAATAEWAAPAIRALVNAGVPMLGICLGHQLLALALGGRTLKMGQGHHGANHPVQDHQTGRVEIVSMNHGFAVDGDTLPHGVTETHVSLFDGTNCGLAVADKPVLSVQHHPEASPGPRDALGVFVQFAELMAKNPRQP